MSLTRRAFIMLASCAAGLGASLGKIWPQAGLPDGPTGADKSKSEAGRDGSGAPGDRWLEMDLYWFSIGQMNQDIDRFWERYAPLFEGMQGWRGLILNAGATISCVMEWSGNPGQRITLPSSRAQRRWVTETGQLTGTTAERMSEWKARFAQTALAPQQGYDEWTYGDLKRLTGKLRQEGERRGIAGFRIGLTNSANDDFYGVVAPWAQKHPEVFATPVPPKAREQPASRYFDPYAKFHADLEPTAAYPGGIAEGALAYEVYAAQWGKLSSAVGFDALMLRDLFGMPVGYKRGGPYGRLEPSSKAIEEWTESVCALVKAIKIANPDALVMMYSNGASAVGDWRANGLDLESLAGEGYLDIFVDQTWAGSWNEVGIRANSFWNQPTLGWTYQLCFVLLHAAILAKSKVRHYSLVETFDAWEDWDVIHTAPDLLRWAIWAYLHAAVKTPSGLRMPSGCYISWANQGKRLLETEDVSFLSKHLGEALRNSAETDEVFGPTLVYSREAMKWQADHATAGREIKEWIDEQAGSVIKWPIPLLSVTRSEWLGKVTTDLPIVQCPSHMSDDARAAVLALIRSGRPVAIFASPDGGIGAEIERLVGIESAETVDREPRSYEARIADGASTLVKNLPEEFATYTILSRTVASGELRVLYRIGANPVLMLKGGDKNVLVWDPPEVTFRDGVSLRENMGGSGAPYALTAGALNFLLSKTEGIHARDIDFEQTMNVGAWRMKDGRVLVLAANLEEGLRDDADHRRHATLLVPKKWGVHGWRNLWKESAAKADDDSIEVVLELAESMLLGSSSDQRLRTAG